MLPVPQTRIGEIEPVMVKVIVSSCNDHADDDALI